MITQFQKKTAAFGWKKKDERVTELVSSLCCNCIAGFNRAPVDGAK